jgi:hypothetical protein
MPMPSLAALQRHAQQCFDAAKKSAISLACVCSYSDGSPAVPRSFNLALYGHFM